MSEWKEIEEFPNYQVSKSGEVKNVKTGRILKPATSANGYYIVSLSDKEKRKTALVHRLVATAFIPNPLNGNIVNHLNGNKKDNHVSNLEWADQLENMNHWYYSLQDKPYSHNNNLKELRLSRGMSQTRLSDLSGVGTPQINKIESGKINIENVILRNAVSLAKALGVKVEELIKQEE